jgi:hypothetical protein
MVGTALYFYLHCIRKSLRHWLARIAHRNSPDVLGVVQRQSCLFADDAVVVLGHAVDAYTPQALLYHLNEGLLPMTCLQQVLINAINVLRLCREVDVGLYYTLFLGKIVVGVVPNGPSYYLLHSRVVPVGLHDVYMPYVLEVDALCCCGRDQNYLDPVAIDIVLLVDRSNQVNPVLIGSVPTQDDELRPLSAL